MLDIVNVHKSFNIGTPVQKDALTGLNLHLEKGDFVTVIGGNGAGKSTIVNAFYFALTGESLESTNIQNLIRWGFADMSVMLATDDWCVKRTATKKGVKHTLHHGDTVLAKKDEVNNFIMKWYGMDDISAFRAVFFAEQFRSIDVINDTNASRSAMLLDVFGFRKFEKIRAVVQSVLNGMTVMNVSDDLLETLKTTCDARETDVIVAQADADRTYMDVLPSEDAEALEKAVAKGLTADAVKDAESQYDDINKRLSEIEEELKALSSASVAADHESARKRGMYDQYAEEQKEIRDRMKKMRAEKLPKPEKVRKLLDTLMEQRQELDMKITGLKERKTLSKDGLCPLTHGAMCADLKALTNPEVIDADIKGLTKQRKDLNEDIDKLRKMFDDSSDFYRTYRDLTARCDELTGKLDELSEYASFDLDAYHAAVNAAGNLDKQLQPLYHEQSELKSKKNDLEAILSAISDVRIFSNGEELNEARTRLESHKKAVVLYDERLRIVAKAKLDLTEAQNAYAQALEDRKQAEAIMKKRSLLQAVRETLHRDAVPRILLDDIRDELNSQLSHFTQLFEFPYDVVWGEDGSMQFDSVTGGYVDASRLSGGQKYVLSLIYRCVLAEMLNATFPVLVLDEPTTGLDVQNRELLVNMLRNVSAILSQRGMSLLIPTHDKLLTASADNVISI